MSMFQHHAARMENQAKFDRISQFAKENGYNVEFRPTKYVRGWPQASTRPYLLQRGDGSHVAAFGNLSALEANLRQRAA